MDTNKIINADSIVHLKTLDDNVFDSCVTDPPYHLTSIVKRFTKGPAAKHGKDGSFQRLSKGFMGKEWDGGDIAFTKEFWQEVYRTMKPGAVLLAFSATRNYHRMAVAIEDAGFEIFDMINWIYGSGFPKRRNLLKPAHEPIVMARKGINPPLNSAFKVARDNRHEFMTVEHLLLAMLDNKDANNVLTACGVELKKLSKNLLQFINSTTPLINESDDERDTQPTLGFQRVIQRAVFHVQSSGKKEVSGANVLVAIFSEQESQAVYFLKEQSVARIDVVNYLSHGISKVSGHNDSAVERNPQTPDEGIAPEVNETKNPLELYAVNLNQQADQGRIDPLIGRHTEVERVVQVLSRRRKNNPLLVGEAGVGKTA
jgi:hypothetical protein